MVIKCWGSRGSIPVSGKDFIKYGGDTTCLEIRTRSDDIIIVDAGTGVRRLGNQLITERRKKYHFIFTHGHWDHVMGFPFFRPVFMPSSRIYIYKCPFPNNQVEKMISRILLPPYFPIQYKELKATISYKDGCPNTFRIGSMSITPVPLSHPGGGCGYKFIEDGKTFVFLTDNELSFKHKGGLLPDDYCAFSKDADLLFHDAEFTPKEYQKSVEWGHSAYTDTLSLALKAEVRQLGLFHLNQERTDTEMDNIVVDCHKIIDSTRQKLTCFAVAADMAIHL
ncbi:MAG: MBL fold metallo-hydrolase [Proteobacteria bacterium]|nr:MBL fold metallo-hydrolase [Pseudomonadota bacterium]